MKFLLLFLFSFNALAIPITNDSIVDADQLRVNNSASITLNNNMDANSNNITGIANLTATGTTTLDTALTGFAIFTSGVLSAQTLIDLTSEVTGVLPVANGGTGSATQNFVDLTTGQTVAGVKTFSSDILMSGTGQIDVPSGTTAQREGTPNTGMFRYNTTNGIFEGYDGAWKDFQIGSPLTTEGDLILGDGSGNESRLAVGTSNQLLTSNGTTASWEDAPASPPSFTTVTKTTTATLATTGEDNVLVDAGSGDFVATLPAVSGNSGLTYKISKSTAANLATIDGNGAETIGGEPDVVLSSKDDSIIITTDGSAWFLLSDDVVYSARYVTNAGQSITSTTAPVVYEDIKHDTHAIYNVSTGLGTIAAPGKYLITARATITSDLLFTTTIIQLHISKNGTPEETSRHSAKVVGSLRHTWYVTAILDMDTGDTFEIEMDQNSGAGKSLDSTSSIFNTMSVSRIK